MLGASEQMAPQSQRACSKEEDKGKQVIKNRQEYNCYYRNQLRSQRRVSHPCLGWRAGSRGKLLDKVVATLET